MVLQVRKKVGDIRHHGSTKGLKGPSSPTSTDVFVARYASPDTRLHASRTQATRPDARAPGFTGGGVAKVVLVGDQPRGKVVREFSHKQLATSGVSPQLVFDSLRRQERVGPAGASRTDRRV